MDEKEKSIALAELMEWRVFDEKQACYFEEKEDALFRKILNPYSDFGSGLNQFATIILANYARLHEHLGRKMCEHSSATIYLRRLTQENILDEILRMNGIEA